MKKLLIILWCICLCGCSSKAVENKTSAIRRKEEVSKNDELTMKEWKYLFYNGDGNEDGYYRIKQRELDNGESISNLCYFDYYTKQEIYLCDKPECLHDNKTCTSYLPFVTIASTLFVYQDHLYLTVNDGGYDVESGKQIQEASLYQIDLDGKNRKVIWHLDEGETFEASTILTKNNKIYMVVEKEEFVETTANSSIGVTKEKKLMSLDLKTKKAKEILDLKEKAIIGVNDNSLIVSQIHYRDDPEKYLENKDYAGYDKATLDFTRSFYKYDLNKSSQGPSIKLSDDETELGYCYRNKIYWINKGKLISLDIDSGAQEELLSLEDKGNCSISNIIDNHLIVDVWNNDEFSKTLIVSLESLEVIESNLYINNPRGPITILNVNQDYLFVIYKQEGKNQKSWAGTDQFEVTKEDYGLISKDDFWNNQPNFQEFKELG